MGAVSQSPTPDIEFEPAQDIKSWLTELREGMRFDGWRFDFARGYDPQYVKEYIEDSRPTFAVGEYWDDCAYIPNTPRLEPNQVTFSGTSPSPRSQHLSY